MEIKKFKLELFERKPFSFVAFFKIRNHWVEGTFSYDYEIGFDIEFYDLFNDDYMGFEYEWEEIENFICIKEDCHER